MAREHLSSKFHLSLALFKNTTLWVGAVCAGPWPGALLFCHSVVTEFPCHQHKRKTKSRQDSVCIVDAIQST